MNHALQTTRYAPRRLATTGDRRAHLVGIASAEMLALAELLLAKGWTLSGSDTTEPPHWLWTSGVRIFRGHAGEHVVPETDLVIYGDSIDPDNAERRRAAELRLRQLSYSATLGELMMGRIGMTVAGTQGKNATVAMTASILSAAGLDPTVVSGGTPLHCNSGGRRGRGRHFLTEASHEPGNLMHGSPRMAVITGIDPCDTGRPLDRIESIYADLLRRLPKDGVLVANSDCPVARRVAEQSPCRVITFGLEPQADWHGQWLHGDGGRYQFEIAVRGEVLAEIGLRVPGRHQVVNALAAACLASQAGADAPAIVAGLQRFIGLKRQLERVGFWQAALWLDDEARHPTEIRATLAAVREMFPSRRIWCIFQPQQPDRAGPALDALLASLENADRAVELGTHSQEETFESVASAIGGGDILLTLGAGDIRNVWNGLTRRLRSYRAAG